MKRFCAAILALAAACWGTTASANLILNGGFESSFASWGTSGNVGIGIVPYFGAGTAALDGTRLATFNAGDSAPNGTISQSFATSAGTTYLVKFDYGVTSGGTQTLHAFATGTGALGGIFASGDTTPPAALSAFSFLFVANSALSTLTFADMPANPTISQDGVLDNVSVTQVPLPGALALLALGLAAFTARRRPVV